MGGGDSQARGKTSSPRRVSALTANGSGSEPSGCGHLGAALLFRTPCWIPIYWLSYNMADAGRLSGHIFSRARLTRRVLRGEGRRK